ncbi:MAG: exopolysaccharide biosynthesis polyprenyl glycosylphosphotransferase [Pseudomonadota bacterium]
MSHAAGRGRRVKTEQAAPAIQDNLQRLAELRAGFEMFAAANDRGDDAQPAPTKSEAVRPPLPALKRRFWRLDPAVGRTFIKLIDWTVVLLAADLAARWGAGAELLTLNLGQACVFLVSASALKTGLWLTRAYAASPAEIKTEHGVGGLALGVIAGLLIANFIAPDARMAAALCAVLPPAAILLAGLHAAYAIWLRAAHRAAAFTESIVLVGATEAAARFITQAHKTREARVVAVVDDRLHRAPHEIAGVPVFGALNDLMAWPALPEVDRIVIAVPPRAETRVRAMAARLCMAPNRVDLMLDYHAMQVKGAQHACLASAPIACLSGGRRHSLKTVAKRVEDIIVGGALLALFAPLMLAIALVIRLDSKGPVIFRQRRHGLNNRVITVLKFRTMRHEPGAPMQQVVVKDPRLTRTGGFLRRTSLDELPQLINVLAGDMSLVGPRPHAVDMKAGARELTDISADYAHRHQVKPGITGWAQVNGSRGPIHTPDAVRERVRFDLDYVARASLLLDLWILLRTAPALLGGREARR